MSVIDACGCLLLYVLMWHLMGAARFETAWLKPPWADAIGCELQYPRRLALSGRHAVSSDRWINPLVQIAVALPDVTGSIRPSTAQNASDHLRGIDRLPGRAKCPLAQVWLFWRLRLGACSCSQPPCVHSLRWDRGDQGENTGVVPNGLDPLVGVIGKHVA